MRPSGLRSLPNERLSTGEARELLHASQQSLVLPALGKDLLDVGTLEATALSRVLEDRRHVLPALVLLERLDLRVELEEVVREVGIDAETLEGNRERRTARGHGGIDESLAGNAAL